MKTIKQVADELNVSKTTIRNTLKDLKLESTLQKNGNRLLISESTETALKRAILNESKSKTETETESKTETEKRVFSDFSEVVTILQKQAETLQKELEAKNQQITALNTQLETAQKSLQNEQALNLNNQSRIAYLEEQLKQLPAPGKTAEAEPIQEPEEPPAVDPAEEPAPAAADPKPKGLFSKIRSWFTE